MRLRLFGIYLPVPKQDAIFRGDVSNTVVNPFFVHAMAGLGMHFCAGVGDSPRMVLLRARHAQRAFEHAAEVTGGNDANLTVQVLFYSATMTLYLRWLWVARKSLTKACIALNVAGLRFIPATGRPPRLTEDVRERVVVLSQVIYLESYMFLAVDGAEPKMLARIEEEFRRDLQVRARPRSLRRDLMTKPQQTYPHLFEVCPLIMRTHGILLVKDAVSITMHLGASGLSHLVIHPTDLSALSQE